HRTGEGRRGIRPRRGARLPRDGQAARLDPVRAYPSSEGWEERRTAWRMRRLGFSPPESMQTRRPLRPFLAAAAFAAVVAVVAAVGSGPQAARHSKRVSLAAGLPAIPVVATGGTRTPGSVVAPPTCTNNAGVSFTCY